MIQVICPVCGAALAPQGAAWRCVQGHCFDVARQGYVNLLTVTQKHSRHPGDTREMVAARRAFLDAGWYAPIAGALADLVRRFCPAAEAVLDAGCGEGYYLSQLGWIPERWGIDISRDAVRYAAARDRSAHWLTATAAHLPFADGGFDCVLSMFALTAGAEFFRVLRPGGIFVQVLAGQGHLPGLKSIIYPAPPGAAGLRAAAHADAALFILPAGCAERARPAVYDAACLAHHEARRRGAGADRAADGHGGGHLQHLR